MMVMMVMMMMIMIMMTLLAPLRMMYRIPALEQRCRAKLWIREVLSNAKSVAKPSIDKTTPFIVWDGVLFEGGGVENIL